MAARISKEIADLRKSCRFLVTALTEQGARVAELLLESVGAHQVDGDEEPRFFGAVVALGRRLEASMNRLEQSGQKVFAANAELSALRARRADLVDRLAKAIVRLRRIVLGLFLSPNLEALGLQSPRIRTTELLISQADQVDEAFAGEQLETWLGEPAIEGEKSAPRVAASEVSETVGELRSTLVRIDETQRKLDPSVIEKNDVKGEHQQAFVQTARSFEAFCRLAGLRQLADKVRPSEQQPGRRAEEVEEAEEEPAPDTEPPDGGPEEGASTADEPSSQDTDSSDSST